MTEDKFSYQNLRVYEDMIRCFSFAEAVISGWEPIHAIVDHFNRASEGAFVCLAEACRTRHIAACQLLNRATRPDFRRIDEAVTSIVLNIAEGNGRFSYLDHSRFLEIANRSNTKLAARIEMCALRGTIEKEESIKLNKLLVRIDQMSARLADTWRNHER